MIMRSLLISAFLLLFLAKQVMPQEGAEQKDIFIEAEDHFLYGEYIDAAQLFPILDDGSNYNILYKIGVCYLNIPNEKNKAINYLEQAVISTAYDAKDESFTEKRAPLDAYFSLANAYRINNDLDKAIATYNKFKSLLTQSGKMENEAFIDQALQSCADAKDMQKNPVSYIPEYLGQNINLVSINLYPAVSADEKTLAFTEKFGEDNVIYFSENVGRGWEPAIDISSMIGATKDASTCALSADGKILLLYKTDDQDGNLYQSKRKDDDTWGKIEKLNKNINTKYYESHACLSSDGNTMYFTSNRKGSLGELDIYVSRKTAKGDWGPAINLGNIINTPFNENTPFITGNDSILYFSSEGHYNIGGYDIFHSSLKADGSWSEPVNAGYPINTTDDNLFYNPVRDGKTAYFALEDGYKEINLYKIDVLPPGVRRNFTIKGTLSVKDTTASYGGNFQVIMLDKGADSMLNICIPTVETGQYLFNTKAGDFNLVYQGKGYQSTEKSLLIDEYARTSEFVINVELEPLVGLAALDTIMISLDPRVLQAAKPLDLNQVIKDLVVADVNEQTAEGIEVLYWTVQLMALRVRPVDVSYFLPLQNVDVILGKDGFYRYTYGRYNTKEEADAVKKQIIRLGYADAWIKKVYKQANNP
jgi:hypothetical protein